MKQSERSKRRFVLLMLAVALVAPSCTSGGGALRPMTLKVVAGTAQLIREGKRHAVHDEVRVAPGDRIVQSAGGVAELRLAAGRVFELNAAELNLASSRRLTLERGKVLANLAGPATVDVGSIRVASDRGTFRVDRTLATRIGVYAGSARLEEDASTMAIPRFRQAIVAGDVVPRAPKPLRIDPVDPWDRRFLQEALDLDRRLTSFGRGLEAQIGASAAGVPFFSRVVPVSADFGFLNPFLIHRRSDVLIALAVSAVASETGGTLGDRFRQAFDLWTDGATWGLIAFEFGVGESSLFDRLVDALRLAGLRFGPGGVGVTPGTQPTPTSSPTPGGPGRSPSPSPSPSPPGPTDPIEELIDDLIDQLPIPLPIPTPPP